MSAPSQAISRMPRSGIREVFDLANTIPGCIRLEVGQPNFATAPHICQAAADAAFAGFTGYTPNVGIPELREALADKVRTRNRLEATPDQVVVTTGGGGALFSTMTTLLDPGDGVLLSDPAWPNYRMQVDLLGFTPHYFPLSRDDGLQPRAEAIEPSITERTRAIVINTPANPTGVVIDREVLTELMDLARRYDLWVISDEVYDEITFDKDMVSTAEFDTDGRVVTIFSFSKTYAMTGWRVGYTLSSPEIAGLIGKCQEPITSCVNGPAQKAALAAVTGPQDVVKEMRHAYHDRRDRVMALLEAGSVPAVRPAGAFYVWVDVSAAGLDDRTFARRLVREREVAVVPGTTFGARGGDSVRLSLATATDELLEGVSRIVAAIHDWSEERR